VTDPKLINAIILTAIATALDNQSGWMTAASLDVARNITQALVLDAANPKALMYTSAVSDLVRESIRNRVANGTIALPETPITEMALAAQDAVRVGLMACMVVGYDGQGK
jgi:hypothetical protein